MKWFVGGKYWKNLIENTYYLDKSWELHPNYCAVISAKLRSNGSISLYVAVCHSMSDISGEALGNSPAMPIICPITENILGS